MGDRHHGITANTYKKFIIDSGAVYKDFVSFAAPGTLLGATKGGSQLTIEQEIKEMEVDGARGPVKGGRRIVMSKITLTVNFIEHTLANLKLALVGSSSVVDTVNWDKITRQLVIADVDFLSNIAILGEVSGTSDALGIQLDDAIVDSNFELTFADKEEGVIAMTFTGHFDPAKIGVSNDIEPWSILWPNT